MDYTIHTSYGLYNIKFTLYPVNIYTTRFSTLLVAYISTYIKIKHIGYTNLIYIHYLYMTDIRLNIETKITFYIIYRYIIANLCFCKYIIHIFKIKVLNQSQRQREYTFDFRLSSLFPVRLYIHIYICHNS